jgi:zinc/manganese transport system substrate-binding protein
MNFSFMKIAVLGAALAFFTLMPFAALAKLTVVTTTTDLRSIAAEVGGDAISADSIAKGTQDPHFVEAKPSFMLKASKADLLLAVGLDLEIGWLPSILRGARNPKINPGNPGYLEVGPLLEPLEVAKGKVTRAEGDVHPFGNPHVTLDPIRAGTIAIKIAERLAQLDAANATQYMERAKAAQKRWEDKARAWTSRLSKSPVKQVVTYHKTLTYFLDRFKIGNPAILEPKPGIPPTSGHILGVIGIIKDKKVPLILVENLFDPTVTRKIMQEVPTVRSHTVPVAVDGEPHIKTLDDLYEDLTATIEGSHR